MLKMKRTNSRLEKLSLELDPTMLVLLIFDFILFTATYRYVLQLEMHVRLIRVINFNLLSHLLEWPHC